MRVIGTESRLWSHLEDEVRWQEPESAIDRIESPITPGASDVHYVVTPWSGWIELKTANWPRAGTKPLRLHSPFTLAQLGWLIAHHDCRHALRSWLLVGIVGARTWRGFVLCAPTPATHLLAMRKGTPVKELLDLAGVYHATSIKEIVGRIRSAK